MIPSFINDIVYINNDQYFVELAVNISAQLDTLSSGVFLDGKACVHVTVIAYRYTWIEISS